MLVRIVRMEFQPEKVNNFLSFFKKNRPKILAFEGCRAVNLYKDHDLANVYFTISDWDNAAALENYRKSAFFERTWSKTKVLFAGKPLAYSLSDSDGSSSPILM